MRYITLILFCVHSLSQFSAQQLKQVKLQNSVFTQPKASDVLDDLQDYELEVMLNNHDRWRKNLARENFNIPRFKKMDRKKRGDFKITIREESMGFTRPQTKVRTKKRKSAEQEVVRTYALKGKAVFKYSMVISKGNEEIYTSIYEDVEVIRGPRMKSEEEAVVCYEKAVDRVDAELVVDAMRHFENEFGNFFMNVLKKHSVKIYDIKNPNKEERIFTNANNHFLEINQSRQNEEGKHIMRMELIQDYHRFLDLLAAKKQTKKVKKRIAVVQFNLGVAHLYNRNYERAQRLLTRASKTIPFKKNQVKILDFAKLCSERVADATR